MSVHYSKSCPAWIRQHIEAAVSLLGNDPIAIGKALSSMPAPSVHHASKPHLERVANPALLFRSHNLIIGYGEQETPWLTIIQNGGTVSRDELCVMVQA